MEEGKAFHLICTWNNYYYKSFLKGLGPNLDENSANRMSKSIGILKEMMDNTDRELEVTKPSGVYHTAGEEKDIATLVAIFKDRELFKFQPGREFQSFPSFEKDLLGSTLTCAYGCKLKLKTGEILPSKKSKQCSALQT